MRPAPLEPGQSKGLLGPQADGKRIRVSTQPTVAVSHKLQLQSLTALSADKHLLPSGKDLVLPLG